MKRALLAPLVLALAVQPARVLVAAAPTATRTSTRELQARIADAERALAAADLERADPLWSAALVEAEAGGSGLLVARAVDGLADVRRLQGRSEEAVALYRRSALLWAELLGPDQPRRGTTLHNLGALLLTRGRHAEAAAALREALAIFERSLGPDSPAAAETRRALARAQASP